jgi:hypothetical protein
MIKFTFHMDTYQSYKEFLRVTCFAAFYIVYDNFISLYGQIFERLTTVSKWVLSWEIVYRKMSVRAYPIKDLTDLTKLV